MAEIEQHQFVIKMNITKSLVKIYRFIVETEHYRFIIQIERCHFMLNIYTSKII
jgi:hypothetical protein